MKKAKATPKAVKGAGDQAVKKVVDRYAGNKVALITVLQEVQAELGYLSGQTIADISRSMKIPASQVYGVATFYTQFRLKPAGKHLMRVCHGTACHVSGAVKISQAIEDELKVTDGETTEDGKFTLETVACLGCCSLAPVMMIDSETYGRLTPDSARKAAKDF
ncbi:NADH-quinone oxidoreductase subunit NuoE [candidate division TA06 bacterium]|uniref:NADH-quinone oxidoreductase subunit NuoE n=1 Tax=candidate division TA06 bacterium TaxID=2250710 RepID=A0A933MJM1_UNCT6|nr:NADH-quinone oxidoreductase subunit NuoE [candidate division TA06 bacterium]